VAPTGRSAPSAVGTPSGPRRPTRCRRQPYDCRGLRAASAPAGADRGRLEHLPVDEARDRRDRPGRLQPRRGIPADGDAAGIGALATILTPAGGLVSLATAGAAGADVVSSREVLEQLRRNFGQLGYMQGVLDENVSQLDGQLVVSTAPRKARRTLRRR